MIFNVTRDFQRNWVFGTNYDFLISISLQSNEIFQTMNSVRQKNLSLKYKKFTPSGGKNIGIRKSAFVTNAQFQWELENYGMCRVNRTINYISGLINV